MTSILKTTVLSAVLGVAALAGATAAKAEGMYFTLGGGDSRVGIQIGEGGPQRVNDWRGGDRRWDRDGDRRWDRDGDRRWDRACTPDRALDKAERMGLRRARIVDVDRRTIDVVGRQFGERVLVTFARAPHCPVIR